MLLEGDPQVQGAGQQRDPWWAQNEGYVGPWPGERGAPGVRCPFAALLAAFFGEPGLGAVKASPAGQDLPGHHQIMAIPSFQEKGYFKKNNK